MSALLRSDVMDVDASEDIPLEEVLSLLAAARGEAEALGVAMSFAVVDRHGHPVVVQRMDGAGWLTADVAFGKAFTAAALGAPTEKMRAVLGQSLPLVTALVAQTQGRFVLEAGGLPLMRHGVALGAIGTSGGTPEQDVSVARKALEHSDYASESSQERS